MSTVKINSQLHHRKHTDYAQAAAQIHQHLGDIGGIRLYGRQVLLAPYVRPQIGRAGIMVTTREQTEDIWQGKVSLIVAAGPDAFRGDVSYLAAMFGTPVPEPGQSFSELPMLDQQARFHANIPKVGDWVLHDPKDGMLMSVMGPGSTKSLITDADGKEMPLYDWEGWTCRLMTDERILGRVALPHVIV